MYQGVHAYRGKGGWQARPGLPHIWEAEWSEVMVGSSMCSAIYMYIILLELSESNLLSSVFGFFVQIEYYNNKRTGV